MLYQELLHFRGHLSLPISVRLGPALPLLDLTFSFSLPFHCLHVSSPLLAVICAGICLSIAANLLAMDPSAAMPLSYPMAIESIHRTLVLILSFSLFCSLLSLPPSFFIIFSMAPFHRSQPASLLLLLLLLLYGRREL